MEIAPPTSVVPYRRRPPKRGELVMRYGAAYMCTLTSIAAAQLIVDNLYIFAALVITVVGLPLSLFLRRRNLDFGFFKVSRFFVNSSIVIATIIGSLLFLLLTQQELFFRGPYQVLLVSHSAVDTISILMELFLIFASFRSLAILTDKDALLCSVPSFSVLLLLIVAHRGPAVVAYFLIWAVFAAVLFTLDHRRENRIAANAVVPSVVPGQDAKLSARGLATVLFFSLTCAIGISYMLSSRNPEERGAVEGWVVSLASNLTKVALNLPDVSVNAGPERQIDFTSGPALPTEQELWRFMAIDSDWKEVRPDYLRMFTLATYDGSTWSQLSGSGRSVKQSELNLQNWPLRTDGDRRDSSRPSRGPRSPSSRQQRSRPANPSEEGRRDQNQDQSRRGRFRNIGYVLVEDAKRANYLSDFGTGRRAVFQRLEAQVTHVGFLPALPLPNSVRITGPIEDRPDTIRVQRDGAIDISVIQPRQSAFVYSEVAPSDAYQTSQSSATKTGDAAKAYGGPPLKASVSRNPSARLSSAERDAYLQLPKGYRGYSLRLRDFSRKVLSAATPEESEYKRALRLAEAVQDESVYTLRPPPLPENSDATAFFLLETKRGYCTHFAGALTILCRLEGIPARVVSGFTNIEWESSQDYAVLREAMAHTWTEVWVPGWGWATVDATPTNNRGDNSPGWWENWTDLAGASLESARRWAAGNKAIVAAAMGILLLAVLWFADRRGYRTIIASRFYRLTKGRVRVGEDAVRRAVIDSYLRVSRRVSRRFRRRADWETPHEWMVAAQSTLEIENPAPLRELTDLYIQAKYSVDPLPADAGATAYRALERFSIE